MNYRKLGGFVLLGLLVVCGIWILLRDYVIEKADSQAELTDLSASYTASEEIAAAAQRLADGEKPAEVVTRLLDDSARVAIVFDGLPERPLAERLLDVLQKHNASAVFFVEGQNAAEQPETIRRIYDTGYEIGNYTFVGISGAEKIPTERLLTELCRTQQVVATLSPKAPTLFRAPRTVYTDPLLQAVKAAGIDYAVKENVRHAAGSFQNAADAAAFAATIPRGSIISIALTRPVDPLPKDTGKTDERPAVDKKPNIEDPPAVRNTPPPPDPANELDWLLTALESLGIKAVDLHDFRKIHYIPSIPPANQGK